MNKVEQTEYQINKLTNTVFNAINDLVEVAEVVGTPYLVTQIVNVAYIIISNNITFRSEIRKQSRCSPANQMWNQMKTFFAQDRQDLCGLDMAVYELGYFSADNIVSHIFKQLRKVGNYNNPPHTPNNQHPKKLQLLPALVSGPDTNTMRTSNLTIVTLIHKMMPNMETMRACIDTRRLNTTVSQGVYRGGYQGGNMNNCWKIGGRSVGRGCGKLQAVDTLNDYTEKILPYT